ncbi:OmpA family protein [Paucibacter sp. Y2R2-4]|uniref:OmpA family protein n=1 Tax=Paucibacter sp. Y2R2-4 TaxID=2893553 RepID=UPI0021E3C1D5|nr:OmpA family protein [Paucibacter sp. Y2R2-4]MCV2352270.1 OmpA family protein [Paucibacter sp. Y2R2-4]
MNPISAFHRFPKTSLALAVSLILGACASPPSPPSAALLQARQTVHGAEGDPLVRSHAPLELKKAADTLSRADALQAKGEVGPELDSAAYVANQQARTAVSVALAKSNEATLIGSKDERTRVLAEQRSRDLDRSRAQTGVAQRRANEAEMSSAMAVATAAGAKAETAQMQGQLRSQQAELDALQAQKTERGMLLTLGDVLFELGRAEIKPAAQQSLRKLAEFLRQHPQRQVLIEGYTDNVGGSAMNDGLSLRRADAVKAALLASGEDLIASRIATIGHGERFPVADNGNASNRALNRRVEVYVSEDGQQVRPRS